MGIARVAACISVSGLALVLVLVVASISGCAGPNGRLADARPAGIESGSMPLDAVPLLPVEALREDLVLRQRVTIRWLDGEESFAAVLQKRGSALLLLGLGPMNVVGFSLSLDDGGVRFENRSGRDLPFAPARIIADIQRIFYPWIKAEVECQNCERQAVLGAVRVVERIGPKALEERRFESADAVDRGQIVVEYKNWIRDTSIPSLATLRNDTLGYQLTVETKSVELLEVESPRSGP